MSPTKRTTSLAKNGRTILSLIPGIGGGGRAASSTSAAVKTCAPGMLATADVSIPTMRAWATGDRTKVAWSASGTSWFSTYRPLPRRNRSSSTRRIRWPIMPLTCEASHTRGRRAGPSPAPDLVGHLDDECQLRDLLVVAQGVAVHGRREAA